MLIDGVDRRLANINTRPCGADEELLLPRVAAGDHMKAFRLAQRISPQSTDRIGHAKPRERTDSERPQSAAEHALRRIALDDFLARAEHQHAGLHRRRNTQRVAHQVLSVGIDRECEVKAQRARARESHSERGALAAVLRKALEPTMAARGDPSVKPWPRAVVGSVVDHKHW